MTIQQLEYIIALDHFRHFASAASACHVTQPALTIQLKKLEQEWGVQLFDRSKQPLEPTHTGKEIIARARQVLRELNHMTAFVQEEKTGLTGTFRLGIIPTLAPYILPAFLASFKQRCPQAHLVIEELQTGPALRLLDQDLLDMAIMATPTGKSHLREITLFYEPFVGYIPPTHPLSKKKKLSMAEMNSKDLLLLNKEYCYSSQLLEVCHPGKSLDHPLNMELQTGSIETLKNLVRAGQGYTLVPALSIADQPDDPRIKQFSPPQPAREISLVVHQSFPKQAILKKVSESILEGIPKAFQKAPGYQRIRWNDSPYFSLFGK
jgi:LysR family transcriptional regulator, hydrogen peroxide-inducible genes activator